MKYLLFASLLLLTGCAAGRGSAGEIVLGFDVGQLVETGDQAIAAAANTLLPGLGAILTPFGLGGTIVGFTRAMGKERARKTSDQARETAERDLAVAQAKLESLEAADGA